MEASDSSHVSDRKSSDGGFGFETTSKRCGCIREQRSQSCSVTSQATSGNVNRYAASLQKPVSRSSRLVQRTSQLCLPQLHSISDHGGSRASSVSSVDRSTAVQTSGCNHAARPVFKNRVSGSRIHRPDSRGGKSATFRSGTLTVEVSEVRYGQKQHRELEVVRMSDCCRSTPVVTRS